MEKHSNLSMQKALVLSCLNIAEDYYNLQRMTCREFGQCGV